MLKKQGIRDSSSLANQLDPGAVKRYRTKQIRRTLGKYDLNSRDIEVAAGLTVKMVEVRDTYELLDQLIEQEERLRRVERFPYWAELWPASLGLSRWFCQAGLQPPAQWVRELGCGLGLVGITLARLGWRVEATDFVEDALILAGFNAQNNQVTGRHRVAYLDWNNPVGWACECMVASDVVYEKKNHSHLARVLSKLLLPGGRFYLSDPQRVPSRHFCAMLVDQGYGHQVETFGVEWKSLRHKVDIHIFDKPLC